MNNTMTSTMTKIPGIGDIPILGYLFRSKAAQKNQTELVVMITPQILREGSTGVTNALPRMAEPYLSPIDPKKTIAPPPAAFVVTPGAASATPAQTPAIAAPVVNAPAAVASVAAPAPLVGVAPVPMVIAPAPVVSAPAPVMTAPAAVQAAPAPAVVVPVPDVMPAAVPTLGPTSYVEPPPPAPAPSTSVADPLQSESMVQRSEPNDAKLREESRLREVRQLAQQAKQQAVVDSKQKTGTDKK